MKKRAAWLLPTLLEGSGGHRTILQNARFLVENGYVCDLYIEDHGEFGSDEQLARRMEQMFGACGCGVHRGFRVDKEYDLVFATVWYTADIVRRMDTAAKKIYFVQDFEALFHPMGDGYLMAVDSYSQGLYPITIGRWLARKLQSEYRSDSQYFDFCRDAAVYRPLRQTREHMLCFICQPEKPRRCFMLGLKALEIVKRLRPDVKICFYGSQSRQTVSFDHEELGLISVDACNALYNRCQVGLCLSSSNPSRIPFEMMAAGLPVVDLHMENNLYDMPDGAVLLAHHTPEAIAAALIQVLDDKELQKSMSEKGVAFMADRPLEAGYRQFLKAVDHIAEGRVPSCEPPARSYHAEAVLGNEKIRRASDEIASRQAVPAEEGFLARLKRNRFLRRNRLARGIWQFVKCMRGRA